MGKVGYMSPEQAQAREPGATGGRRSKKATRM
jgi:hypothetical protein